MVAPTAEDLCACVERICPWPCKLGVIAHGIIVLAALKVMVQYFRNRKARGSTK
jgi:hypothetical protein